MALGAEEYARYNALINMQLRTLRYDGVRFLHVFLPILKFKEPDLYPFFDWLKNEFPAIRLVLPKVADDGIQLENYAYEMGEAHELATNKWGISEPTGGDIIDERQLDMVILPLLAFDLKGNRLGYGKGFYDRFLSKCRPDVIKIGISFFGPNETEIKTDAHDQKLTMCVTPLQVYHF